MRTHACVHRMLSTGIFGHMNHCAPLSLQQLYAHNRGWEPLLRHVHDLHRRSTHPAAYPFPYAWEEIGPGYCYGTAFGHWDIVHQVFDALVYDPEHARHQLYNTVYNQTRDGMVPGCLWLKGGRSGRTRAGWDTTRKGHPPVWVAAVDDYVERTGERSLLPHMYAALVKQISWFERHRRAPEGGFFYEDIRTGKWESGVDEGVRFDDLDYCVRACIDATTHVYMLYNAARRWAAHLGEATHPYETREMELHAFINDSLYDERDRMYYDERAIRDPVHRHIVMENLWPLVAGAAPAGRAHRIIDTYVLSSTHFCTPHPIATVSAHDTKFELRMWRGPCWNSMTYWVARGCLQYGRKDAARLLLHNALDATAVQFDRTGKLWEFYHPFLGPQHELRRKPHTNDDRPCTGYLGHNPLLAMAGLHKTVCAGTEQAFRS